MEVTGHGELSPPVRMLQAVFLPRPLLRRDLHRPFRLQPHVAGRSQRVGAAARRLAGLLPPPQPAHLAAVLRGAHPVDHPGGRTELARAAAWTRQSGGVRSAGTGLRHFAFSPRPQHRAPMGVPHHGPMWSVATEWQIYFIFALVLLPLYRRFGTVSTVVFAWGIGVLPLLLLPPAANLVQACPWFLGSFALGMAGAALSVGPASAARGRRRMPWGLASVVLFASLMAIITTGLIDRWSLPLVDFVVSLFAFTWINSLLQAETDGSRTRRPPSPAELASARIPGRVFPTASISCNSRSYASWSVSCRARP